MPPTSRCRGPSVASSSSTSGPSARRGARSAISGRGQPCGDLGARRRCVAPTQRTFVPPTSMPIPMRSRGVDGGASPAAAHGGRGLGAGDDRGLVHDRDGLHLDQTGSGEHRHPGRHRDRAFLEAQQVAEGVFRDPPPPGGTFAHQQGELGGDDHPVTGVSASAEHHVADDEAPPGAQPSCRAGDERRLVRVAQVVQRVVGDDEVAARRLEVQDLDRGRDPFDVRHAGGRGVRAEELDHRRRDVDGDDRGDLVASGMVSWPEPQPRSTARRSGARARLGENPFDDLHEAGVVLRSVVPARCACGPEASLAGDVGVVPAPSVSSVKLLTPRRLTGGEGELDATPTSVRSPVPRTFVPETMRIERTAAPR